MGCDTQDRKQDRTKAITDAASGQYFEQATAPSSGKLYRESKSARQWHNFLCRILLSLHVVWYIMHHRLTTTFDDQRYIFLVDARIHPAFRAQTHILVVPRNVCTAFACDTDHLPGVSRLAAGCYPPADPRFLFIRLQDCFSFRLWVPRLSNPGRLMLGCIWLTPLILF